MLAVGALAAGVLAAGEPLALGAVLAAPPAADALGEAVLAGDGEGATQRSLLPQILEAQSESSSQAEPVDFVPPSHLSLLHFPD